MTRIRAAFMTAAVTGTFTLGCATTGVAATPSRSAPSCAQLANKVALDPTIKSASSGLVPKSAADAGYCEVALRYGATPGQNINIVVALPLSAADGGKGGVQGAWNGRTQGLGGGGCAGNMFQPPFSQYLSHRLAVNAGYVASGNDLGHTGGDCTPGVNVDGTYNSQFIEDFIRNGVKQQVLWSKAIAREYYGAGARFNYWNGCSTGGRQGYLLAQELGNELEGILANDPAIYWTRFQTAQMWGQIVMRERVGAPISSAKLEQARRSAIAACDSADGVTDGIIDDPRTCEFSAAANVCGAPTAPAENCLTSAEAAAIDRIWDGPRNSRQNKIWFGLDRGTDFKAHNGPTPFILGLIQFQWDMHDRDFDWTAVSPEEYPRIAQHGSVNIADVTDTAKPLDAFKAHGGKLLTILATNDQAIFPRGAIHYYRQMATRYGNPGPLKFDGVKSFYRLFRAPGTGHCGSGEGPSAQSAFETLVNWVEHGVAPDSLLASGGSLAPSSGRTRPLCPYPQTAIYNGSGSKERAESFHCGGDVETRAVVCRDVLARYKQEESGDLDFAGTGVSAKDCQAATP